ncbi:mCG147216 [Mus musculus]|jgi:hypothetical protein|nr:mCG147216 [Mus musculus]
MGGECVPGACGRQRVNFQLLQIVKKKTKHPTENDSQDVNRQEKSKLQWPINIWLELLHSGKCKLK